MRVLISAVGALGAAAALAAPAGAAVSGSHVIAVLPDTSGLELTYEPDTTLAVSVHRGAVTLSTASVTTDDTGAAAVNGGGAECWSGVTPDLLPGDTVEVTGTTPDGVAFDDTTVVAGVTAARPIQTAPGTVVVHGTAAGRPPSANLEARIVGSSAAAFDNGKRVLRAGVGQPYSIDYDGPGTSAWTATFSNLSSGDVAKALDATDSRGVVLQSASELTISQNPAARGPQAPCTAPLVRDAATSSSPSSVNISHAGQDLVVSGISQDAGRVDVALDDEDPATAPVTAAATPGPSATGNQTWSVTVPGDAVAGLSDGTLTASTTFAKAGGPAPGGALSILKDLSAPDAPTATPSPAAGPFAGTQIVRLSDADRSAAIHWTGDGSDPSAVSPVIATGAPIPISSSQTIKAVAIDPAGNASATGRFSYTIATPVTGGSGGGSSAGATTIIQQIPLLLPAPDPGRGVLGARASRGLAVHGLSAVLRRHALRVAMRLDDRTDAVRLRLYRVRDGQRTGTPLMTAVRHPVAGGRYAVTLHGRGLRALRTGTYVLEAQAASRGSWGATSRRAFTVG